MLKYIGTETELERAVPYLGRDLLGEKLIRSTGEIEAVMKRVKERKRDIGGRNNSGESGERDFGKGRDVWNCGGSNMYVIYYLSMTLAKYVKSFELVFKELKYVVSTRDTFETGGSWIVIFLHQKYISKYSK